MDKINDWQWEDKVITESTNDDALVLSSQLTGTKFIITAEEQTKGRGRRGRQWISLKGNLFFSQGIEFETRFLGQLICLESLSLYQTMKALVPSKHKVNLKWPNDVLIDDCKVSGTLLEKGKGDYFIIGTGVNICVAPTTKDLLYPVTSLAEKGINIDRIAFLRSYIDNFDNNYELWQKTGFAEIKQQWINAVKGLHQEIVVKMPTEEIKGIFEGIGDQGELLLQTEKALKKIFAGDIFYIKKEE